ADLAVGVDVGLDGALGGLAAAHLQRLVAEADAQQLDGGVDVAVCLAERLLAVHHARAGAVAQLLDLRCGDRRSAHLDSSSFFLVVFFLGLSSSWTASATAPAAPAAALAAAPSGPGARSATASATVSAVLAAVSATSCAVSTAWLAASCARSTTPLSDSPSLSAGAASAGASASAASAGASL